MIIEDIKELVDDNIRQRTLPGTITRTNHAQIEDAICEEQRTRGVIKAASTGELDEHSHTNTTIVIVQDVGIFVVEQTPASPDNDTTFASFDSGWLWRKWINVTPGSSKDTLTLSADGTYTLADGNMIDLITSKPVTTQTQKYGTTLAGDEIMLEQELTANVMRAISIVIVADGADVTLYFTGITANTVFTIYKRKL